MLKRHTLPGLILLTLMLAPGTSLAQSGTPDADDPMKRHLDWGLELLGGNADELTVAEVEEHLDPSLLEHYPAEQFIAEVEQLSEVLGPLELVEDITDPDNPTMFRGVFRADRGVDILLMVEIDPESGLISNLDVAVDRESHLPATPATPAGTPPS